MTEITLDIDDYDREECFDILFNGANKNPSNSNIIERCDENILKNADNELHQFFVDMKNKLVQPFKEGFINMRDEGDYKMDGDEEKYDK